MKHNSFVPACRQAGMIPARTQRYVRAGVAIRQLAPVLSLPKGWGAIWQQLAELRENPPERTFSVRAGQKPRRAAWRIFPLRQVNQKLWEVLSPSRFEP